MNRASSQGLALKTNLMKKQDLNKKKQDARFEMQTLAYGSILIILIIAFHLIFN